MVKTGRTHLQDATPVRLGQEFKGFAGQAEYSVQRLHRTQEALAEVQRAVSRAQGEADLKTMQEELNKAEKALMKARQELWKKLRAQQTQKEKSGGSKSKPASRKASGEPPTHRDSGRDANGGAIERRYVKCPKCGRIVDLLCPRCVDARPD